MNIHGQKRRNRVKKRNLLVKKWTKIDNMTGVVIALVWIFALLL